MLERQDIPEEIPAGVAPAVVDEAAPLLGEGETLESVEPARVLETAKEYKTMLEVHPAHHPASSWKEFIIHIATIVLGLLIAVGLEQTVEYFHHRRELSEVREELRGEREANRASFKTETTNWRWETAELENNLMVLTYLQKHPGTPNEKLPGGLLWFHASAPSSQAAWYAAKNSDVTRLMSREEVEGYEGIYDILERIDNARTLAWDAMNDASRYELTADNQLSHLSPAQIGEITTLTQIALTKQWLEGVALENTARIFKDFPPSITSNELSQVRNRKNVAEGMNDPAFAQTISRIKAAGFVP